MKKMSLLSLQKKLRDVLEQKLPMLCSEALEIPWVSVQALVGVTLPLDQVVLIDINRTQPKNKALCVSDPPQHSPISAHKAPEVRRPLKVKLFSVSDQSKPKVSVSKVDKMSDKGPVLIDLDERIDVHGESSEDEGSVVFMQKKRVALGANKAVALKTRKVIGSVTSKELSPKTSEVVVPKVGKEPSAKTSEEVVPKVGKEPSAKTSEEVVPKIKRKLSAKSRGVAAVKVNRKRHGSQRKGSGEKTVTLCSSDSVVSIKAVKRRCDSTSDDYPTINLMGNCISETISEFAGDGRSVKVAVYPGIVPCSVKLTKLPSCVQNGPSGLLNKNDRYSLLPDTDSEEERL